MTKGPTTRLLGRVQRVFTREASKGFGFILTDDAQKFFFHAQDVKGQLLPEPGSLVRFRPIKQTAKDKNDRAVDVEIASVPS